MTRENMKNKRRTVLVRATFDIHVSVDDWVKSHEDFQKVMRNCHIEFDEDPNEMFEHEDSWLSDFNIVELD